MSDFSDRPFAAGSLIGIRSWRVDTYGRLQASQVNVVWTPGEMVARCMREQYTYGGSLASSLSQQLMSMSKVYGYSSSAFPDPTTHVSIASTPPPEPHRVGSLSCTCGFYAYFDNGPNTYHAPSNVQGLVEGYGVTTVGTRGFRAEKARIKALIVKPKTRFGLFARVLANYPDVPVFERKRDALAEFPLTPPSMPGPELDLDFWTRETL